MAAKPQALLCFAQQVAIVSRVHSGKLWSSNIAGHDLQMGRLGDLRMALCLQRRSERVE